MMATNLPTSTHSAAVRSQRLGRIAFRFCWIALICCSRALAQGDLDPKALLQELNGASIDPSQTYFIRNAQFTRDRVHFYLNRGFIGFLTPVQGEITGAVFAGDGEVLLFPPDQIEKASLLHFTGSAILAERFDFAYFRFTDQTARELLEAARRPESDDPQQPTGFAERWVPTVRRLNPEYSVRILIDLLGERDKPCLLAYLRGRNLGAFEVEVDERLPEAARVGAVRHESGRRYLDIWCSFPSRNSGPRFTSLMLGSVRVKSYQLDTRINPDNSLEGHAVIELESRSDKDRAIPFELSRFLEVTESIDEDGQTLTVIQNPSSEDSETVRRGSDWIVAVLPHALPVGKVFRLHFAYRGNVIADAGNGVLHVGDRSNWYPNRGSTNRATYDLTFHYPEHLTLVATGERVEETASDGWKHSRWILRQPQAVAGFNLGAYHSRERQAGSCKIEVYATQEVEAEIAKRNARMTPPPEVVTRRVPDGRVSIALLSRTDVQLDPAASLDSVADVASETVLRFGEMFGPLSSSRLAITQVPGHSGQGWPGLVYLPTMAFLPSPERRRLGFDRQSEESTNELTLAHEIAHQWWGNHVGWQAYRDQWLSEGFATYSAALQLAAGKDGERKLHELLRNYKADLLSKTSQGVTIESGGPIFLGQRLSNSLNPDGYANIIYKKSCWVIHMLRELMSDGTGEKEDRFFKMLRQFIAEYEGRSASTEDFIRHAEKHMTPAMDLEGNHRLDWFFDDWVYGTGIPTYKLQANVKRAAPKRFVVQGTIEQGDVPAGFEMPVPLVADYSNGRKARLGWVVVGERPGEFRFTTAERPLRVAIDEDSILAVVR